jgi:hypothetical protein
MRARDPFDLEALHVDPADPSLVVKRATVPTKILKRRNQFIMMPMPWFEKLAGTTDQTHRVVLYLLHLHWKGNGGPIKLANGMLRSCGVSPRSKWRALAELEQRGLIEVERRPRRSPIVHLMLQNLGRDSTIRYLVYS